MDRLLNYKAVIFDLDGTLVDSSRAILKSIEDALKCHGIDPDQHRFSKEMIGPRIPDLLKGGGIEDEGLRNNIASSFREIYDANPCHGAKLYRGIEKKLSKLQLHDCTLFVATNKPKLPTKKLLNFFHLNFFEDVVCPDSVNGMVLSKAEMIARILSRYSVPISDVIMVGDTRGDFEAARFNGIDFAFAPWGYEKEKLVLSSQANVVLENLDD